MSYAYLLAGLGIFLGVHSISIVSYRWRDRMAARLGTVPWRVLYALVAVVGLVLIFYGYASARRAVIPLRAAAVGARHDDHVHAVRVSAGVRGVLSPA
jgi:uncharacterized membrane protein